MPSQNSTPDFSLRSGALCARYQEGLLAWLKHPESGTGLSAMITALEEARDCSEPAFRILAGSAIGFLREIEAGRIEPSMANRKIAAWVEMELTRVFRGDPFSPNDDLLRALRENQPDNPARPEAGEARAEIRSSKTFPPIPKDNPLADPLTTTAAILPLFSKPSEPRFTTAQRKHWDHAVEAVALAWAAQQTQAADWHHLRRAVTKLQEGALALEHPAPLELSEALASALDGAEQTSLSPRRLTAISATVELISEPDFLEHEALAMRVEQLARRLRSDESGSYSSAISALFVSEVAEEIDDLRHALDAVPPDVELLTEAALRIRHLAEPLELSHLSRAAFCFADTIARIGPAALDHPPGRDEAFSWVSALERWVQAIGDGSCPDLPTDVAHHQKALQALLPT